MPMYKKSLLILLCIAIAAAGGALYGCYAQEDALPLDAAEQTPIAPENTASITVYVTGAVNQPGIVALPEESRISDAVNACGGILPTADPEAINMAQKLADGQQIRIPEKKDTQQPPLTAAGNPAMNTTPKSCSDAAPPGRININTADEKKLESLPGIGPAMAKRIVEYRSTKGQFQAPEELKKIKGIGNAKYEKLKDKITL